MRRFLLAASFFVALVVLWQVAISREDLVAGVVAFVRTRSGLSEERDEDGTLGHATVITMRRLLIGYVVGIVGGLPLGLI